MTGWDRLLRDIREGWSPPRPRPAPSEVFDPVAALAALLARVARQETRLRLDGEALNDTALWLVDRRVSELMQDAAAEGRGGEAWRALDEANRER